MKIAIAGASGFIGSALCNHLMESHELVAISREPQKFEQTTSLVKWISWNEFKKDAQSIMPSLDAIVNLCGANIGAQRWTKKRKEKLLQSRIRPTETLIELCQQTQTNPTLIQASGVGIYPPDNIKNPGRTHTESDPTNPDNTDFLSFLSNQWEASAQNDSQRIVTLRFGVVCNPNGGAIRAMLPIFKRGLGGPIGSGQQPFPWVALNDVVHIIEFCLNTPEITGPVNVVSPTLINQKQLAQALGKQLRRPALIPLPAWMVTLLFGEMGRTLLLQGQRVYPQKLLDHGYEFLAPTISAALE